MTKRSVCALLSLLTLALAALPAQTADCVVLQSAGGVTEYVNVDPGDSVSGRISIYQDPDCETEIDYYLDNRGGFVYEDSLEDARDICEKNNPDYLKGVSRAGDSRSGKQIYQCDVSPRGSSSSDRSTRDFDPSLDAFRLDAFDGMESGIVFQRRGPGAIGIKEVIDFGFLDAVDVWSNIGSGFSVCFPEIGRIVFLEAATSPRTIHFPEYHHEDGQTCAAMTIAGTMVLVEEPQGTTDQTTTTRPDTDDDTADATDLDGCKITTNVNLNLRQAPWGQILDTMPANTKVTATARTNSWFKITHGGTEGWSAAWLVNTEGDCDWSE